MKNLPLHEALLYEKLPNGYVKCDLCGRRCRIPDGKNGFCRVRKNGGGRLFSLNYAKVCSLCVDPIGKKPLTHFHPGAVVMSVASVGCNFRCKFCDNWVISQETRIKGTDLSPERLVELTLNNECQGVSYTYTEPTIFFEYAFDTAKIAHEKGLFNTFVTNGYMTPEAVDVISPYLDAATVDLKGGGDPKFYREYSSVPTVEPIYECLKTLVKHGVHVEVTNLVVPKVGDSMENIRELASWIRDNLGKDTPLHLLRFHPSYMLTEVPSTPLATLEKAYEKAKDEGLNYVYLGNVPGHKYENTYCPNCGELLIKRFSFDVTKWRLNKDMRCPSCGYKIAIKGEFHQGGFMYPYSLI